MDEESVKKMLNLCKKIKGRSVNFMLRICKLFGFTPDNPFVNSSLITGYLTIDKASWKLRLNKN